MDAKTRFFPYAAAFALSLCASVSPAHAHHGWSGYDAEKTLTLNGKIVASGYEHPHGHLELRTADNTWNVVLAPPYRMERRGLTRDMLKPGSTVTVVGYPHRTEADELRAERIVVGDTTVELR